MVGVSEGRLVGGRFRVGQWGEGRLVGVSEGRRFRG